MKKKKEKFKIGQKIYFRNCGIEIHSGTIVHTNKEHIFYLRDKFITNREMDISTFDIEKLGDWFFTSYSGAFEETERLIKKDIKASEDRLETLLNNKQ